MTTPAVQRIWDEAHTEFPGISSMGITNCRSIAGSETASQHAWSNAWDITSPAHMRVNGLSDEHYTYMDTVNAWLETNRETFAIRVKLWRVTHHYDHIHVDTWPKGVSVPWSQIVPALPGPPCAGGTLTVQWPDGTIGNSWEANVADHTHQRGPFAGTNPKEWGEAAWMRFSDAVWRASHGGGTSIPESVNWETTREDISYNVDPIWGVIDGMRQDIAEIQALIQEPPSAPPSGGSGGGPSGG